MNNQRPFIINGQTCINKIFLGKVIKNNNSNICNKSIQVLETNNINTFSIGYGAYLFQQISINKEIETFLQNNKVPFMKNVNTNYLYPGDIVEINYQFNKIRLLYKGDSYDNVLIVTNQCNSNCIMCPDSLDIRKARENVPLEKLKNIVRLMKPDTPFICITGGEPTLLKKELFNLLDECKRNLNNTQFVLLTNGRMFYYKNYTIEFIKHRPNNTIIAIPIHGHIPKLHDVITQSNGSFEQTIEGIKNLYKVGEPIEIRIVVSKLNYNHLVDIAYYIINNFPNVFRVNLMAMEMLGNAILNAETVWVDFDELQDQIIKATLILIKKGINTYLYNFPLCYVNKNLWSITVNSISAHKVRYREECNKCKVKNRCGGFFNSTMYFKSLKAKPI